MFAKQRADARKVTCFKVAPKGLFVLSRVLIEKIIIPSLIGRSASQPQKLRDTQAASLTKHTSLIISYFE